MRLDGGEVLSGREILDGVLRLGRRLGRGGMAVVYEATERSTGRQFAVKVLRHGPRLADDALVRFHREAAAMERLTHPHTARVYLYGEEDDGLIYFVMERLDGRSVHQLVREMGALRMARAISIALQTCGALEEAHACGIVHRDIKSENIFVCRRDPDGDFVKLIDFGLARVAAEIDRRSRTVRLTGDGLLVGTPEFMSPEQARGDDCDARSDIYSLGVVLYEMLTGLLPFEATSARQFLELHIEGAPIPLSRRVPGLVFEPTVESAVHRALSKDPGERPQSMRAFADVLAALPVCCS